MTAPPFRGTALRVGLTGGIASGKSTVSNLFAERGVPVVDMDLIAREVVEPGQPGLDAVIAEFGAEMLRPDGRLDRPRLRALVFSDTAARLRLEALLHPRILAATVRMSDALEAPWQLIAAPLLVERGLTGWVDRVLVVDCPQRVQVQRLMARDGCTEAEARSLLAMQATRDSRLAAADDIIENTGGIGLLAGAVDTLSIIYREIATTGRRDRPGVRLP